MELEGRYVAVIMGEDELKDVVKTYLGYVLEDFEESEIDEKIIKYAIEMIFSSLIMKRATPDALILTDGDRILDWAESERMFVSMVQEVFGVDDLMGLLEEL